jgi:cytochrome c oxidase assembly protein subunit 15
MESTNMWRHHGSDESPWPHRLALLTTGATFLLILVGGVVTATGAGLAVPDWPTTFGYNMFTFPFSGMVGGILYEHSHRLIGSLVGLLTVALAVSLWAADRRSWVRWLGAAGVLAVVFQGVLGGLRVVLVAGELALLHGFLAHAFLGLAAALTLFTSRAWKTQGMPLPVEAAGRLSGWLLLITAGTYVQIVLGAVVTHTGRRLDAHLGLAVVLSVLVPVLTRRVRARFADRPEVVGPARFLLLFWIVQLFLGVGAYGMRLGGLQTPMLSFLALFFPVAHRLGAAAMLVASLVLTLQLFRLSRLGVGAGVGQQASGKVAA